MESQRDYLRRRALEEEAAARRASCDKIRDLHMELASRYRDAATAEPAVREAERPARTTRPNEFRILE